MKYELSPLERAYLEYDRLYHELQECKDGQEVHKLRSAMRKIRLENGWTTDALSLLAHAARIKAAILESQAKDAPSAQGNGS